MKNYKKMLSHGTVLTVQKNSRHANSPNCRPRLPFWKLWFISCTIFKILWKIRICYIYALKFSKWHINDRNYMLKPWNVLRFSDFLLHIHTSKKTSNFCFYYRVKSVPWKNKNNAIKLRQRKRSIVWNSTICGVINPN